MPGEPVERREKALAAINVALADKRIEVYRDLLKQPHIIFRFPGRPDEHWLLSDERVDGLIAALLAESVPLLPYAPEVRDACLLLSGLAMRTPRTVITDVALLRLLEQEPVLEVVVEFMHDNPKNPFEVRVAKLCTDLSEFLAKYGLQGPGRRRIPTSQWLGRKLRLHREALRALQVEVTFKRSNGSVVTLTRLDTTASLPSVISSDDNLEPSNELRQENGIEARLERLRAKQVQPRHKMEE
jgi:hypothetical protein